MQDADRQDDLKTKLVWAEERIKTLTGERDEERAQVARMREHVADANALIESWIEAFDMTLDDNDKWSWSPFIKRHEALAAEHAALIRRWNRFVGRYNVAVSRRNVGRPLAASEAQARDVLHRRKAGESLRNIADDTSLGLRTVRTICEQAGGRDRSTLKRLERIAPDRFAEAAESRRKRTRDALPRRIDATLKGGRGLLKETSTNRDD